MKGCFRVLVWGIVLIIGLAVIGSLLPKTGATPPPAAPEADSPRPATAAPKTAPPVPTPTLLIDVRPLFGLTRDQVDAILGQPYQTLTVSPGEITDLPAGGTSAFYRPPTIPYELEIVFDMAGVSRGVILEGADAEKTPCDRAAQLVAKLGITVPAQADTVAPAARRWNPREGYSVFAICPQSTQNVRVVQVWRVQ